MSSMYYTKHFIEKLLSSISVSEASSISRKSSLFRRNQDFLVKEFKGTYLSEWYLS